MKNVPYNNNSVFYKDWIRTEQFVRCSKLIKKVIIIIAVKLFLNVSHLTLGFLGQNLTELVFHEHCLQRIDQRL